MEEKLYSTAEVAEILGRTAIATRLLASRHGIGRKIGNSAVYTEADLEALRKIDPRGGRPRKDGKPNTYKANGSKLKRRGFGSVHGKIDEPTESG